MSTDAFGEAELRAFLLVFENTPPNDVDHTGDWAKDVRRAADAVIALADDIKRERARGGFVANENGAGPGLQVVGEERHRFGRE